VFAQPTDGREMLIRNSWEVENKHPGLTPVRGELAEALRSEFYSKDQLSRAPQRLPFVPSRS
jgi:hypothetical protein